MKDVENILVTPDNSIKDTMIVIQQGGIGIALLVDKQCRLIATITDGDIRRAILNKIPLDTKIGKLFENRSSQDLRPISAPIGTSHDKLLLIMKEKFVRHIPLLDKESRVKELICLSELIEEEFPIPLTAVLMAGGKGERLYPLTKDIPKPMLPLENSPLMERIILQLRKSGIKKVNIATNYIREAITNHFGDGNEFGVDINYIIEDRPLGTAGALGLMEVPDTPTLVVNADILTQLDFRAMFDFHLYHKAVMTVAVRKCDFKVPYGVIETEDVTITNLVEKPVQTFMVNAGIYLLEPIAYKCIPKGCHFDMTDLVILLLKEKLRVISFPIQEYWLDVGHPLDYRQAEEDAKNGKV